MNWFQRILGFFRPSESPTAPAAAPRPVTWEGDLDAAPRELRHKLMGTALGIAPELFGDLYRVSPSKALALDTVWRAVSLISNLVAGIPIKHYRRVTNEGRSGRLERQSRVARILRDGPGADSGLTGHTMWQRIMLDVLVRSGNSYWLLVRNPGGTLTGIRYLPNCRAERDDSGSLRYRIWAGDREFFRGPEDILHFRGLGDDDNAFNPIDYQSKVLGLGGDVLDFASSYFQNGASARLAIEIPDEIGPEASDRLAKNYREKYTGRQNQHEPLVLELGTKANQIGTDADKSQMLDTDRQVVRKVANLYGIPPHYLGDDAKSSHSSLEAEERSLLNFSLNPWLLMIEAELNSKLGQRPLEWFEYERKAVLSVTPEKEQTVLTGYVLSGVMLVNEARAVLNLEPIEGGDRPLVPVNLTTLEAIDSGVDDEEEESEESDAPTSERPFSRVS